MGLLWGDGLIQGVLGCRGVGGWEVAIVDVGFYWPIQGVLGCGGVGAAEGVGAMLWNARGG